LTIRNEHPVHFWEKKNNEQVERWYMCAEWWTADLLEQRLSGVRLIFYIIFFKGFNFYIFIFFNLKKIFLLFTCAYNAWVITFVLMKVFEPILLVN
jgi:hypothetical protein